MPPHDHHGDHPDSRGRQHVECDGSVQQTGAFGNADRGEYCREHGHKSCQGMQEVKR